MSSLIYIMHFHVFIITLLLPISTVFTNYYMLPTGQLADAWVLGCCSLTVLVIKATAKPEKLPLALQ